MENDLSDERKSELCLKCLKCCDYIAVRSIVNPNNFFERQFYQTRGCTTMVIDNQTLVFIPFRCPHVTKDGCDIYENRPHYCKTYDGRKDPFMKDTCLWGKEEL